MMVIEQRIQNRMVEVGRVLRAESSERGIYFLGLEGVPGWLNVVRGYLLMFSNEELFKYVGAYAGATRREAEAVIIEEFFPSP